MTFHCRSGFHRDVVHCRLTWVSASESLIAALAAVSVAAVISLAIIATTAPLSLTAASIAPMQDAILVEARNSLSGFLHPGLAGRAHNICEEVSTEESAEPGEIIAQCDLQRLILGDS